MNRTKIEWTDFSANPLKFRDAAGKTVWACVHASPGCQHCYAETLAKRWGRGGPFNVPTMAGLTPFLDEDELRRMLTYKPAAGKRCFVGDMTDIFGQWVPDALLDRLFCVMALRSDVTWQVLTKRAARMRAYMTSGASEQGMQGRWGAWIDASFELERAGVIRRQFIRDGSGAWFPPKHIWLGVSVEDQPRADERIPELLQTPAAVRFISAEPLIGQINLDAAHWLRPEYQSCQQPDGPAIAAIAKLAARRMGWAGLDWVIAGGESGPGARMCSQEWIRSIVQQCRTAGTACFVKQLGAMVAYGVPGVNGGFRPRDRKGVDLADFPNDLRIREFPRSAVPA